jgi:hypothetical protein
MLIHGGIVESGKYCVCLTAITLGWTPLDGQDMSISIVLAGIQKTSVLRLQEPAAPPTVRPGHGAARRSPSPLRNAGPTTSIARTARRAAALGARGNLVLLKRLVILSLPPRDCGY